MSWKEKIGQNEKRPSGSEERRSSKEEDKSGTPSRKRPRSGSDEVFSCVLLSYLLK